MNKFLYFQDGHYQGKNSINRLGDYFSDWLLKFDEILSLAKQYKVEAILDGGDLFHAPNPSYRILDEIADRVEKVKIPIYSLFGNHAQLYHSLEHSQYTGLSHLQKRSKYFQYLNEIGGQVFQINGVEYKHNIEEEIKLKGINFLNNLNKWNIVIVHAFVCPEPFPYATHVQCSEIKTNADLVLCGHYHKPFKFVSGDTTFLNIGCFGRNSITEAEIEPSCVLLDTDKRNYKIIKLKSAKKDIFDLSKKEEILEHENKLQAFIEGLKDINIQGTDLKSLIIELGRQNNTEKEIIDLILDKINLEVENAKS